MTFRAFVDAVVIDDVGLLPGLRGYLHTLDSTAYLFAPEGATEIVVGVRDEVIGRFVVDWVGKRGSEPTKLPWNEWVESRLPVLAPDARRGSRPYARNIRALGVDANLSPGERLMAIGDVYGASDTPADQFITSVCRRFGVALISADWTRDQFGESAPAFAREETRQGVQTAMLDYHFDLTAPRTDTELARAVRREVSFLASMFGHEDLHAHLAAFAERVELLVVEGAGPLIAAIGTDAARVA